MDNTINGFIANSSTHLDKQTHLAMEQYVNVMNLIVHIMNLTDQMSYNSHKTFDLFFEIIRFYLEKIQIYKPFVCTAYLFTDILRGASINLVHKFR